MVICINSYLYVVIVRLFVCVTESKIENCIAIKLLICVQIPTRKKYNKERNPLHAFDIFVHFQSMRLFTIKNIEAGLQHM